jgi:hypothetical protein
MRRARAPLCAALALAVLALAATGAAQEEPARPRIYKWVDENGIAHYTTDRSKIPSNLRGRIRDADEVRRSQAQGSAGEAAATAEAPPPAGAPPEGGAPSAATPAGTSEPAAPPAAPLYGAPGGGRSADQWSVRDAPPQSPEQAATGTGAEPAFDPEREARAREVEARIVELEAELAKEEDRLKQLISEARLTEGQPAPLYGVPELEELARRFPKLQADLSALRAERRRLAEEP